MASDMAHRRGGENRAAPSSDGSAFWRMLFSAWSATA